jgi:hypothetical protein
MVNPLFVGSLVALVAMQSSFPSRITREDDIIVVGRPLTELEAAVSRCADGNCSVREDVIASVRYAEALFREGDYRKSRSVLQRSVSRTRKDAARDPMAVAELHSAQATVASHYGDTREALRATAAGSRLLTRHLPNSPQAFMARLNLIVAQLQRFGGTQTALALEKLSSDARAQNQPLIAMRTDIHRAALLGQMQRYSEATALLEDVRRSELPGTAELRLAAQILQARTAAMRGDKSAIDSLVSDLAPRQEGGGPMLVWSPPLPTPGYGVDGPPGEIPIDDARASAQVGLQWVDVGFLIGTDGAVESVEILRGSHSPGWAGPLLGAIAQRRYTPSAEPASVTERYRIERYTLTASFSTPPGSRIRQRVGQRRFERVDLTQDTPGA